MIRPLGPEPLIVEGLSPILFAMDLARGGAAEITRALQGIEVSDDLTITE
jgi:hypothetical protein